jgi:hypothetical protein
MNKLLKIISASLVIILYACEDDLIIQSSFKEGYVLNCVIDANSAYQIATITRTYNSKDALSPQNFSDRFVENVELKITNRGAINIFMDSSVTIENSPGVYKDIRFYFTNDLRNTLSSTLYLTAILPGGDTLTSSTTVPSRITIDQGESANIIPPSEGASEFTVNWKENDNGQIYFDPRLKIIYYKLTDEQFVRYEKEIPIKYNQINGKRVPLYISPSFNSKIDYSMDIFNEIITGISEGDPDKSNYYIESAQIDIYTYDLFLTSYYIGTHMLDKYSIRLDEVDYTNIDGGYGIFGSFVKETRTIAIDPRYIKSFGYEPYFVK